MSVVVRDAVPGDLSVLVRFNRALAEESEGLSLDLDILGRGVEALLADPAKGAYFVAERDGQVVGQTMITFEWSDWRNGWIWWIQSVYVRAEDRRTGVLRALLDHIGSRARERGVVGLRLYVEQENSTAQAAYERLGFRKYHFHLFQRMGV